MEIALIKESAPAGKLYMTVGNVEDETCITAFAVQQQVGKSSRVNEVNISWLGKYPSAVGAFVSGQPGPISHCLSPEREGSLQAFNRFPLL